MVEGCQRTVGVLHIKAQVKPLHITLLHTWMWKQSIFASLPLPQNEKCFYAWLWPNIILLIVYTLQVWIEDKFDYMERGQYFELVLFPECLIKIYMTLFSFDKEEAERRIFNTPFRRGDDEYSSEDEK